MKASVTMASCSTAGTTRWKFPKLPYLVDVRRVNLTLTPHTSLQLPVATGLVTGLPLFPAKMSKVLKNIWQNKVLLVLGC